MTRRLGALVRRFRRDERGGVFVLVAVAAIGLAAIASYVIDYGRVMNAQKELQAAADAAALAAAQELPTGPAVNVALTYGATAGGKNTRPDLPNVVTTANTKCLNFLQQLLTSPPRNCQIGDPPNAIQVDQDADVQLAFLGGLGLPRIHIHASSLASMKGGSAYPLDVMIVLDRTGSMSDPNGSGTSKIVAARAGIQSFLKAMRPSSDRIGLALFPPTNATACNYGEPSNPYENAQNGYAVVPLANDFKTSDSSATLNAASKLVKAVTGGCPATGGTTAYTTAIHRAKEELDKDGRSNAQDVIIFFTDGQATYGPYVGSNPNDSPERRHPCQSAIDLVNSSFIDMPGAPYAGEPPNKIQGTWMYTILYGTTPDTRCRAVIPKPDGWDSRVPKPPAWDCAPTTANTQFPDHSPNATWKDPDGGYYCQELPHITAQHTLQTMASVGRDGTPRFYTSQDDLTGIFKRIAIDLSATRLLPDNTQ